MHTYLIVSHIIFFCVTLYAMELQRGKGEPGNKAAATLAFIIIVMIAAFASWWQILFATSC